MFPDLSMADGSAAVMVNVRVAQVADLWLAGIDGHILEKCP